MFDKKQMVGLVALAITTVFPALAQTVPAEEWVGAPMAFHSTQSRAEVTAALMAAPADSTPAELRVGPADAGPGAVPRAVVEAERNLWIRAGLAYTSDFEAQDPQQAQRLANYARMRAGPEFAAELGRVSAGQSVASADTAQ